ncbi:MAG: tetratricopeptide repeat protein [Planctomycetia bacterium]
MLPSPSIASLGARFRGGVAVIVPLVLTLVAYGPSMHGPFVFDGVSEIARNEGLRTLWPPWVPMFTGGQLPQRPLPYLSFALNLAACGIEPFGWHLVNVAIHLGNGLLAWFVVREILARTAPGDGGATAGRRAAAIAWAVATLWLVHPLCTQAVSYLYQRIELLAATCILASLACQLRADDSPRPHAWRCGSILACATGMLCKESAAAAPLVLLLVAWLAGPRPAGWRSLVATLRSGTPYWAALAATWLVAAAVVFVQRDRFGEFARPKWTPLEYALQQPRSILRYLQLAIWPRGQCVDYGWLPVPWPRMLPGWTALGVLVAAFVRSAGRCPRLAIAIGSFLILLGPTSSLLPVIDLCVEHRMYLPLLPLVAIVCVAVDAAVRRWWPGLSAALQPAAVGCGLVLAAVTFARNGVWSSAEGLWQDAVEKEPDNPRAAVNLAAALLHEGRFAAAAAIASRGLAVEPAPTGAMRASLLTWLARGRSGAGDRSPEVLALLDAALAVAPRHAEAHFERGALLMEADPGEAERSYARAITIDPGHANACNNLAGMLVEKDRPAAIELMRRAVAAAPERVRFRLNLARLLDRAGQSAEAAAILRQAMVLRPTAAERAEAEAALRMLGPPAGGPARRGA